LKVKVPTTRSDIGEIDHVITWCGATIHGKVFSFKISCAYISLGPHRAVLQTARNICSCLYVNKIQPGSPASVELPRGVWITHVNKVAIVNMEHFVSIITTIADKTSCQLRIIPVDVILFILPTHCQLIFDRMKYNKPSLLELATNGFHPRCLSGIPNAKLVGEFLCSRTKARIMKLNQTKR
jgi:hypothetical protein